MPIFKRNNVIGFYIHIPKTAGSSATKLIKSMNCDIALDGGKLENSLKFNGIVKKNILLNTLHRGSPCTPQHIHNYLYDHVLFMDKINFNFTIIRHPKDRIISEFFWVNCTYTNDSKYCSGLTSYDKSKWDKTNDFSVWLKNAYDCYQKDNYVWDNHLRRQTDYIIDSTKIFKFGEFDEIPSYLNENLGTSYSGLKFPLSNSGRKKREINITKEDEKLIEEWYNDDYELYYSI